MNTIVTIILLYSLKNQLKNNWNYIKRVNKLIIFEIRAKTLDNRDKIIKFTVNDFQQNV